MTKRTLIFIMVCLVSESIGQPILKISVNNVLWNGEGNISIHEKDTIKFSLEGDGLNLYQFANVSIEILVRSDAGSKEKKHRFQLVTQSSRIKYGPKEMDLARFVHYGNFSTKPTVSVPCNLRDKMPSNLSRLIIHIREINTQTGSSVKKLDLKDLGYGRTIKDGLSFWAAKDF